MTDLSMDFLNAALNFNTELTIALLYHKYVLITCLENLNSFILFLLGFIVELEIYVKYIYFNVHIILITFIIVIIKM